METGTDKSGHNDGIKYIDLLRNCAVSILCVEITYHLLNCGINPTIIFAQ